MKRIMFLMALVLMSLSIFSDTVEKDGISYNLNYDTKEAAVTAGTNKYKGDITIPTFIEVNEQIFKVTSIEDAGFADCDELKSVIIPSSINKIGLGIFSGCNELTNVVVSNDNMVYDSRYDCNAIIETETNMLLAGCNNSTIPYSVRSIAGRAFENCTKMKNVNIPNSMIEFGGFTGCENLSEIIIPNSVLSLYANVFKNCKSLKSINLSPNLTIIYYGSFENSGLQSISIPHGVSSIEDRAFCMCNDLKDVVIPNSVTNIGKLAFYSCFSLNTIKIPQGLEILNDDVFFCCTNLKIVYLPKTLKSLGSTFNGCNISDVYCFADEAPVASTYTFQLPVFDNNTTLHVPAKSIDKYKSSSVWNQFGNIVALTDEELKIYSDDVIDDVVEGIYNAHPDSYRISSKGTETYGLFDPHRGVCIKDNGDGTYYVDDLLGEWYSRQYGLNYAMTGNIIIAEDGKVTLKDSHVNGWDDSLISLTGSYDASTSTIKIEAEYVNGIKFYQTWVKDKQVKTIEGINYKINHDNDAQVVRGIYSGAVTIPNNISYNGNIYTVSSIKERAFEGCSGLESVTIPNNVVSIEDYVFDGCSNMTSVNIPNSVYSIGQYAFGGCNNLSNLNLPDKLTTIGEYAFCACHNVKALIIPASVLKISHTAFEECDGLESINVDNNNIKYDSRNDCNAVIETPTNKLVVGCKNTVIPQDITTIGSYAFLGCSNLTKLVLPNSVTCIEFGAFWNCNGLKVVIAGSNVEQIKGGAFNRCSGLKDFYIYAEKCPTIPIYDFDETPIENATLHVPAASIELYKTTAPWSRFGSVVALTKDDPIPTGISSISMDKTKDNKWYDLNGRKFESEPNAKGIYIINGEKVFRK